MKTKDQLRKHVDDLATFALTQGIPVDTVIEAFGEAVEVLQEKAKSLKQPKPNWQ